MKRIKYLGIYLPKETKDLYIIENYITLVSIHMYLINIVSTLVLTDKSHGNQ